MGDLKNPLTWERYIFCSYIFAPYKKKAKILNDVIYASVLLLIIRNNQCNCENNVTYQIKLSKVR